MECAWFYMVEIVVSLTALVPFLFYLYSKITARPPRLYGGNSRIRRLLLKHCACLSQPFFPLWWCPFGALQTVVKSVMTSDYDFKFDREILKFPDGGQVALDWNHPASDSNVAADEDKTPIVIILPGLTGSSAEFYVQIMVHETTKGGYRSVVFNNRGNGGIELLTPRTYNAAYTGDLRRVIEHVNWKYPSAIKMGVGYSLGGMILFNYLSECSSQPEAGIAAAMCISSPWNPFDSTRVLSQFPYHYFDAELARGMCNTVSRNRSMLEPVVPDFDHLLQSRYIREFDERYIVPSFGYRDLNHYYEHASLHYKIHHIPIPTVCLNAADDSFAPCESIPFSDLNDSQFVTVVLTSHGGHIGFLKEYSQDQPGYSELLFNQLAKCVFNHF